MRENDIDRREFLGLAGAACIVGSAGCTDDPGDDEDVEDDPEPEPDEEPEEEPDETTEESEGDDEEPDEGEAQEDETEDDEAEEAEVEEDEPDDEEEGPEEGEQEQTEEEEPGEESEDDDPDEEPGEEDDDDDENGDDDDPEGRPILITATDAETGDPIEGADVHMASADGDPADAVEFSFTTDSDGEVDEVVEIGNLILTIEAEGYETYSTELSLDEEHHAELEPEDGGDPGLQDALEVVDRQTDVGHDTDNEYILFENTSSSEVDLSGHVVTDREEGGTGIEAPFPDGFTLGPGDQVRVTSGSGSPTDDEIFMDSGRAVWRQDGDEVLIVGPGGDVVFSYSYGDGGTSSIQFVFNQVRSLFA
ncbi:lamin tail domain-containing protein [Halalkalicoccus tibetensis]|uniref:Lamin tail domain-containing protein n=1 Tax=Halalkalicoccus tibetensis TaxID=175632 RepID=A0ABD5V7H1_9EURY